MSFNLNKLFDKLKEATENKEEMKHQRTVCVDVDGTIAKYDGWKGPDVFGEPIVEVVDKIKKEKENGSKIIIHTTRTNPDINKTHTKEQLVGFVKDWLDKHQIPYDDIWSGTGKPIADVYVDDRAIHPKDFEPGMKI